MSDLKTKLFHDKPVRCSHCGEMEVWHVLMAMCDHCFMVHYLQFRWAMNWPLTEAEKKNLGLVT